MTLQSASILASSGTFTEMHSDPLKTANTKEGVTVNSRHNDLRGTGILSDTKDKSSHYSDTTDINEMDNTTTSASKTTTQVCRTTPPTSLGVTSVVASDEDTSAATSQKRREQLTSKLAKNKKSSKKKEGMKRRDEIDDIFAGL